MCPLPPEWLGDSEQALALWHEHAPTLNALGLLEKLDAVAFAMLCDAIAGYLRIRDELGAEQLVLFAGESGYPTPNPLCALMRGQTKAVRELLSDFGMTPSSRSSLTGSTSIEPRTGEEIDPISELIKALAIPPAASPAPRKSAKKRPKKSTKKPAKRKATPKAQ